MVAAVAAVARVTVSGVTVMTGVAVSWMAVRRVDLGRMTALGLAVGAGESG
jgi:hypothetical protein